MHIPYHHWHHYPHACLWVIHPKHQYLRLPLKGVEVQANVVDFAGEVSITQTFTNNNSSTLEAVYVFPLDTKAAVYAFEVDINGRKSSGHVEEKQAARDTYNAAVAQGDDAQLLEQARSDVFQLKVGNLAPGERAVVTIKYIAPLAIEGDAVRFVLPVSVCPRYTPASAPLDKDTKTAAAGGGGISHLENGLSFSINCCMPNAVTKMSSPTHKLDVRHTAESKIATASLRRDTYLDKEVVVLIETEAPHQPRACLEKSPDGTLAGMVTFCPKFQLPESKCEFVFLVDQSGSMRGKKMAQTREALSLFLHSLPADCYFNIVGFGSRFVQLWPKSKKYAADTLKKAVAHADKLGANLGGTQLLEPLSKIFSAKPIPEYSRQVFVLTDGAISNTDQVIQMVRRTDSSGRIFSLGVGNDVSHELVEELAKAGQGTSEFAIDGERIQPKVIRQLNDAMQPSISDISVEWVGLPPPSVDENESTPATEAGGAPPAAMAQGLIGSLLGYKSPAAPPPAPKKVSFQQSPHHIPPIFNGSRFAVYFLLDKDSELPSAAKITATTPEGKLGLELPLEVLEGELIHRLAAKSLLKDLEFGPNRLTDRGASAVSVKEAAVELGVKYQLASKWTSFVAVQENDKAPPVKFVPFYGPCYVPVCRPHRAQPFGGGGRGGHFLKKKKAKGRMAKPMSRMSMAAPTGRRRVSCEPMRCELAMSSALSLDDCRSGFDDLSDDECEDEAFAAPSRERETKKKPTVASLASAPLRIARLQQFNGSFKFSTNLADAISSTSEAMQSTKPDDCDLDAWCTALVINYVRTKLSMYQDDWMLFIAKAEKWLETNADHAALLSAAASC